MFIGNESQSEIPRAQWSWIRDNDFQVHGYPVWAWPLLCLPDVVIYPSGFSPQIQHVPTEISLLIQTRSTFMSQLKRKASGFKLLTVSLQDPPS